MTNDSRQGTAIKIIASDSRLAWSATVLLALYSCWVGFVGFRRLPTIVSLHAGMGLEGPLPAAIGFFGNHPWVFLLMYLAFASGLVYKETVMKDKRRSITLTCLLAVVLLIVVDASRILLIDPIYTLFEQLS